MLNGSDLISVMYLHFSINYRLPKFGRENHPAFPTGSRHNLVGTTVPSLPPPLPYAGDDLAELLIVEWGEGAIFIYVNNCLTTTAIKRLDSLTQP